MKFGYSISIGGETHTAFTRREKITISLIIYTFGFILGWLAHVSF